MGEPPPLLDGARVLRFAVVDAAVAPTGGTVHRIGGRVVGPATALAVCRYDGDGQFYLFSCAEGWRVVTDTCHSSLAEALAQAEFEYRGVSSRWQEVVT
jgi:hypothetical protein